MLSKGSNFIPHLKSMPWLLRLFTAWLLFAGIGIFLVSLLPIEGVVDLHRLIVAPFLFASGVGILQKAAWSRPLFFSLVCSILAH